MIGYVTLGTNDMARAAKFYDAFSPRSAASAAWKATDSSRGRLGPASPGIGIIKPFDGKAATVGNG